MSSEHQQVTGNVNSFNVFTNYNIVNFDTETNHERHQILQWLSPLEPQQRHQGVRTSRLDGIGNWVIETNEFRRWRGAGDGCAEPVLFCDGNPGVGKTHLSSLVIDSLCDQAKGKDVPVVGLYCDFLAQQEQTTTSMLGAILKQLVSRGGIPEYIRGAFQEAKKEFGGRGLRLPDLVEIMKKVVTPLPRVFICIDALDESTPKHRRELLESLWEIVRVSANTRLFLTGRPHIGDEIMKCFGKIVRIPIIPTREDIRSYLEMRLDSDTDPDVMDDELRADIMRVIPEKVSEIFLLVSLNIDAILGELTLHQRRKKLDEMTKGDGLGGAYAATLSRVQAQPRSRSKLGMQVLVWVSHSERPLHADELCHALGVEEGSSDLNIRNIPRIETLLACTLGLVTVERPSSTLRLIHYTLQEYLSHNPNLFLKPHSMIAEVCLTYLNFLQVKVISPTLSSAPQSLAFVEYSSLHWGTHARLGTTETVKALALKLLDGYDQHISSRILLGEIGDRRLYCRYSPGFIGLHGAAYFGCTDIIVALLKMKKWGAQATDSDGNTALAWAARMGHGGVVGVLLAQNDVSPNMGDENGRTPLFRAAQGGHEGVARILLERNDVNPNTADKYGQTPLSWAAGKEYEGVVRILLERNDVNPDTPDGNGRTPLLWAAWKKCKGIMRMLLERNDVNPDTADGDGRTPLSWAAEYGQEETVRILLERNDVNPNTADKCGRAPLSWAAGYGQEETVRILLERTGVNPNIADIYGRTPLSLAAGKGDEGVVKILLERNDVNPNTADKCGQTPLLWAIEYGQEDAVRILLERNDIIPDTPDEDGQTPLLWAAQKKCEGIVRMLLERSDVNPDTADGEGRTPLSWAAEYGREETVRILLERNDVNPDTTDGYGETPLSWAVQNRHERIANLLGERMDFISRYAAISQPRELFSTESSEPPEPPSKRIRRS